MIIRLIVLFVSLLNISNGTLVIAQSGKPIPPPVQSVQNGIFRSHIASGAHDNSNTVERVQIYIKAVLNNGVLIEYPLSTRQELAEFQRDIGELSDNIVIVITTDFGERVTFDVQRNSLAVSKNFKRKYFSKTGEPVVRLANDDDYALSRCHFYGHNFKNEKYITLLSLCGGVEGIIEISGNTYILEPVLVKSKLIHFAKSKNPMGINITLAINMSSGATNANEKSSFRTQRRHSRAVRLPAGETHNTRYLEMHVVMDHSMYRLHSSIDDTVSRAIGLMVYASYLLSKLDIYVVLVGVEVWNVGNQITYEKNTGSSAFSIDKLNRAYRRYRQSTLSAKDSIDSAFMFSAEAFDDFKSHYNTPRMCGITPIGEVIFDDDIFDYITPATKMVHALGHILGLHHTNSLEYAGKNCECQYPLLPSFKECIMEETYSTSRTPESWSQCTKDRLRNNFGEKNVDLCLKNKPEKLKKQGNYSSCGNYFIEPGEECDCGWPSYCDSKCCDPNTCKLYSNATCATGACCDLNTCTIHPSTHLCRDAQEAQCDLQDYCGGVSEWCPTDTHKPDGMECTNRGPGYCYNGKCNTHDSQCYYVWGVQSARKSSDVCYQNNKNVAINGNCGWTRLRENHATSIFNQIFKPCKAEKDILCGVLYCQFEASQGTTPRTSKLHNNIHSSKQIDHPSELCATAAFNVDDPANDPGQVPNGAKCGAHSMCVDSECVPIPQPTTSTTTPPTAQPIQPSQPAQTTPPAQTTKTTKTSICSCDNGEICNQTSRNFTCFPAVDELITKESNDLAWLAVLLIPVLLSLILLGWRLRHKLRRQEKKMVAEKLPEEAPVVETKTSNTKTSRKKSPAGNKAIQSASKNSQQTNPSATLKTIPSTKSVTLPTDISKWTVHAENQKETIKTTYGLDVKNRSK